MKKVLVLNISTDSKDTSLGFAISWVNALSINYDNVDVITLNKGDISTLNENVNVYEVKNTRLKLFRVFKVITILKDQLKSNSYNYCLSHMSPLLSILAFYLLKKQGTPNVLWYAHPGPNELSKKITLYLSKYLVDKIITSTENSFPIKSKKINVIGQAINFNYFVEKKPDFKNFNFLILSRISKSKKIEESIDGFLKSIYSKNIIYIIGGPATSNDKKYLSQLKQKYKSFNNVVFKGVVPHNNLKEYLENVNFHINQTSEGNYDKSVLETTVSGILNFYRNSDYDKLFPQEYVNFFKFNNGPVGLAEVISSIEKLNEKDFSKIIKYSQDEIKIESLETLDERIKSIL